MADPVGRVVAALPPGIERLLHNRLTSSLFGAYVGAHNRLNRGVHTRSVAGASASFETPSRHAWYALNWEFEQERPVVEHAADALRDTGIETFYDVGANVGCFACLLGQFVDRTHAFEPYGPNAALLRRNADRNDVAADVHRVALSDRNGELTLQVPAAEQPGSNHMTLLDSHPNDSDLPGSETVPAWRLDDYVREHDLRPPDAVKIDVEGAEPHVLRGMERLLDERRPLCYVEPHGNASTVRSLLRDAGYQFDEVAPDRNDGEHPTIVARP